MFSGIIEGVGTALRVDRRGGGVTLVLRVPEALRGLPPGSSVAVNGTCLTVVKAEADTLTFDAVGATMKRTLLGGTGPGARFNLERSLRLGAPVDGHLVTGHVDGLGTVEARRPGEGAVYFDIRVPEELAGQIAARGSIAVDGVSLTVAEVRGVLFPVSIVPYTLEHTILGEYRSGRRVHLETDVLAKYVERALDAREGRRGLGAWLAETEKTQ